MVRSITASPLRRAAALLLATALFPSAAQAQDTAPARNVMVGGVLNWSPAFPGAAGRDTGFFPLIAVWDEGERMPVETPDESFGFGVVGESTGISVGPALTVAPRRRRGDTPLALDPVGFGVEAGGFVQAWAGEHVRLRGELRHGIGGHAALTGDLAADLVVRTADDRVMVTAGPRLRWGSGDYTRAFYGVSAADSAATGLPVWRPDGGVYAYGAVASAHVHVTPRVGVYGYAGYDRLTGDAARSPIVRSIGDRDQLSFGVGLSYRFTVRR